MGARAITAAAIAVAVGAADPTWGTHGVARVPLGGDVRFVKAERVAFSHGHTVVFFVAGPLATSVRFDAASFDSAGRVERRLTLRDVAMSVDAQGRLLVNGGYRIGRLRTDGRLDSSFGTRGWVRLARGTPCGDAVADVEPAPDGEVVAVSLTSCDPNATEKLPYPYRVYRFLRAR